MSETFIKTDSLQHLEISRQCTFIPLICIFVFMIVSAKAFMNSFACVKYKVKKSYF